MAITDFITISEVFSGKLRGPASTPNPLSPREQQVVDMIAGGRSQKETAFELGVSHATVRVLYARAMKRLGGAKPPAKKLNAQP